MFGVEDLFAVGLGFDIAGAYLLGRGLLASAPRMARSKATVLGMNSYAVVAQAEDRVSGLFGLPSLIAGFVIQAVAYALVLGGQATDQHGVGAAVLGLVVALVPALLVIVAERHLRERQVKAILLDVARYSIDDQEIVALPSVDLLISFGYVLGEPPGRDELNESYAHRVWGVSEVRE